MPLIVQQIASGQNNPAGLQTFKQLSPPLFRRYWNALNTEWHNSELVRNDSLGYPKEVGKPYVVWIFTLLTEDEYAVLRAFAKPVTIYTYNKREQRWATYNGDWWMEPETPDQWRNGRWHNIRCHIEQLTEIV